jgi:hypothetical protein
MVQIRPASPVACRQPVVRNITLPAETFHMGKCFLICSLVKPREKTEADMRTYDVFIYGDIHYITNVLCKSVLKWTPLLHL